MRATIAPGSIAAIADHNGTRLAVDSYDEYGIPGAGNTGPTSHERAPQPQPSTNIPAIQGPLRLA